MRIRESEGRPRLVLAMRRVRWWAAACAAVAALASCGGSSHKTSTTTSSKTTATAAAHPPAKPAQPIVTVNEVVSGGTEPEHMRVGIYDLRRDGPYLVLDFGIRCLDVSTTPCNEELAFAAPSHTGPSVTANANRPGGVRLVDPASHKEFLPVRDSQSRPFTSQLSTIDDSAVHLAWVVFPAPQGSVGSLDVVFPNGGPQVPGIQISSPGTPPTTGGTLVAAQPAPFATTLGSTDTTGLTLPIENLTSTVGNPNGSDSESATKDTVTLRSDVLFHFDKSNLTSTAHTILGRLAPQIKSRAIGTVTVTGYTDSIGSDAVNIPLSIARAHSVQAALGPLTPGVTYQSAGKGSADPVAPNTKPDGSDNPAGRALNRRVTITFAVKAPSPPTPPPAAPAAPAAGSATQARTMSFAVTGPSFSDHYQVAVNDLFRESDLIVLRATVTCAGSSGASGGHTCDGETDLAGTATVPPQLGTTSSAEYNSLSGFYLRDPATGTEYIPLQDSDGRPLTAGTSVYMGVGDAYPGWVYFPAPPSSVSALTVVAPGGSANVADVPISPSPPAQP